MIVANARNQRRRGFTFIEMFCTMMLLGAFTVVGTQLFGSVMRVFKANENEQTRVSRYEQAIERMRRDVWSAGKIAVIDSRNVELAGAAGKIIWRIDGEGTLIRTVDQGSTRWEEVGKNLVFDKDAQGLLVNERGGDPALATRLFNQTEWTR